MDRNRYSCGPKDSKIHGRNADMFIFDDIGLEMETSSDTRDFLAQIYRSMQPICTATKLFQDEP